MSITIENASVDFVCTLGFALIYVLWLHVWNRLYIWILENYQINVPRSGVKISLSGSILVILLFLKKRNVVSSYKKLLQEFGAVKY